jgi:periplasmic protein TonB
MLKAIRSIISPLVILISMSLQAQSDSLVVPSAPDSSVEKFAIIEELPQFPGGEKELFKFVSTNLNYPDIASQQGIEGIVYVTFTVEKDGSVGDIEILRGIGGGCDEEALRVVSIMPAWKPGTQKGKPVSVRYNMPVRFSLSGGKKKRSKKS